MITRKQLLALIGFVALGALIIWLGRDDPSQRPKFEEQPPAPITAPSAQSDVNTSIPPYADPTAQSSANQTAQSNANQATQSDANQTTQSNANQTTQSDVNQITLPHDDPEFPPGPGRELFLARCTVCHSLRYITMQPNFSKKTWAKEVAKMINTYRAHITGAEAKEITEYLAKVKGLPEK